MIGFITSPETALTVINGIREAQESRGQHHYWTTGAEPIFTGDNSGKMFIPASDQVLNTPLRNGLTPRDFPEFDQLVALLGGLSARSDLDLESLIDPEMPDDPDLEKQTETI